MENGKERFQDYPVFKGLQRPLEFLGLQGRYIYWAAAIAGASIAGFIAGYCLAGFVTGLAVLAVLASAGAALILFKQRKGLHSKKDGHGIYIYARSRQI